MGEEEEKPKVELVQSKEMMPLFTIEICEPLKEQLDKVTFCGPYIVVKPCSPIMDAKCMPDMSQLTGPKGCIPNIWWEPLPIKIGPEGCIPRIWWMHNPLGCPPRIW